MRLTTVFRVAQEALTNVARHAGAKRSVGAFAGAAQDALILDVEDDGRGLAADSVSRQGSFGLIGIREGGHLRLSNGNVEPPDVGQRGPAASPDPADYADGAYGKEAGAR